MTTSRQVTIPIDSRYKDTSRLESSDGKVFYDLWVEPVETAEDVGSTLSHLPLPSDVGRLDLIADLYYRNVVAWWALCAANGLRDQVEDMQDAIEQSPRKMLTIPRSVAIQSFLTR